MSENPQPYFMCECTRIPVVSIDAALMCSFDRRFRDSLLSDKYFICRVKSGNFGHQANSDIHLQTVEIQMRRLLMSRLIRIFTVCLFNLLFHSNN